MQSNNYKHLTVAGTYPLAANSCSLEAVLVNTAAGSSTITVTEGTSAQVIAVIDSTAVHKHDFDLTNLDGLRVVIAGGNPDVTVIFQ